MKDVSLLYYGNTLLFIFETNKAAADYLKKKGLSFNKKHNYYYDKSVLNNFSGAVYTIEKRTVHKS